MSNIPWNQSLVKLTLLVYMDGLAKIITHKRNVLSIDSLSFGSINSQDDEVQSTLDRFYNTHEGANDTISSVDLIFVNSIFHETKNGILESYKNRLPAFLLYHKEFFQCPVTHVHIAQLLTRHLVEWQDSHNQPALWFHLRKNHLFVLFGTSRGDRSVTSFEVRKTLDVFYYILFNIQTLEKVLPNLNTIIISGELIDSNQVQTFFNKNVPDKNLITFWQWKELLGRPGVEINSYLPEVNI